MTLFITVASLFYVAVITSGVATGRNRWARYIVPATLAGLYACYMGYVMIYTSTCEDCRSYQSSPEEVRSIAAFYSTGALFLATVLYGIRIRDRTRHSSE